MNPSMDSGNDSFLDIVANLVGILIILVVVVGTHATAAQQPVPDQQIETEFARVQRELSSARDVVAKLYEDNHQQEKQVIDESQSDGFIGRTKASNVDATGDNPTSN